MMPNKRMHDTSSSNTLFIGIPLHITNTGSLAAVQFQYTGYIM